jgi:superfamily II DNA or RNA helicase
VNPVRIVVDSRVRLYTQELTADALEGLRIAFTHENPAYSPTSIGGAGEPPRYETFEVGERERVELDDGEFMRTPLSFPRGGLGRVRAVLRAHGLTWTIEDRRTWNFPEPGFPDHRFEQRDYQREMIDAAVARQNCLLHAPTGAGKTCAMFGLIARLKRRALVMVWTGNLLEQWEERCRVELGFSPGVVRGDSDGGHPWLDLAMQQTIVSRFARGDRELASRYDFVGCDEVQRFAAPTLFASVDPFTARYRVGVSADSTRKDKKEFLTRDLFGDVAAEVTENRLVENGAVVEVEICVVPTEFRAPWYRYRQDFNKLLAQMVADEARNEIALQIAQREIDQGEQVLLFSHRVEHARSLDATLVQRGYRSGVMLGGAGQAEVFRRTAAGLRATGDDRKMAGVGTYQAIAQGLDLPSVSRGIAVTPIGNNRQQVGQTKGRLCRSASGKESGRLYYLVDVHVYGRRPVRNFTTWFKQVRVWEPDAKAWIDGREWLQRRGEK